MSEEFDTQVRDDGTACTKYELFSGKGTRIKPNGIKYIGEWKDGGYDGNGTLTYPNGTKYIGEFKGRDFNGNGTMTYSDGHKYSGEFVDGAFNGNGTLTFPDKSVLEGKFKDGKTHGYGVYTDPKKEVYEGYFEKGKQNGEGTLKQLKGDKVYGIYNGTFKDSLFHGKGKYIITDKSIYEGEWELGRMHGNGIFYNKKTGENINGIWKADKLIETKFTTYNVLEVMRSVFHEHCIDPGTRDKWLDTEDPEHQLYQPDVLIVLHNPGKMFDVTKPITDEKLCQFIFRKDVYDKHYKGTNQWTGVKIRDEDIDIYKLSIIDPPKSKSPAKSPVKSPMKSPAKSPAKSKAKSLKTQSLRLKSISKKNSTRRAKSI